MRKCPNSSRGAVDELSELIVLVSHSDGLICWNLIEIVYIFEKIELALGRWNNLQVLQDLHRHLRVHHRVWLLVCHLATYEEVSLTQFVQESIEWKTIVDPLLNCRQIRQSLNRTLKEDLIVVGHFEVLDELGDGEDFEHGVLID